MDILHLKSPKNWINDPNGFIYFKGKYHLFYQHFPYEPVWGTMHWGHAESSDLVHWEHRGIAIYPSKDFDMNGVFSGNSVMIDGKMYIYYTGIKYRNPNPQNIHVDSDYGLIASQCLLISEDGEHFDQYKDKLCLIPPSTDEDVMSSADTRDPKVIFLDGKYYMILGSAHNGMGRIIFMESDDAVHFSMLNSFESESFGSIFECPDLFSIGEKQILLGAFCDYMKDDLEYRAQELYRVAEFSPEAGSLKWEDEGYFVDYGTDLYATQTNLDNEGRRVLLAWMRMPVPKQRKDGSLWSGLFTLPRVVTYRGGHLFFAPHPNTAALFDDKPLKSLPEGMIIDGTERYSVFAMKEPGNLNFKISVDFDNDIHISLYGYEIDCRDGIVSADRSRAYPEGKYRYKFSMPRLSYGSHLDIYVDEDVIEIYANGGEYVLSNVIYLMTK